MNVAVLADIHSNEAALRAVLEAADRLGAERLVVLGDLVGYGARPKEVLACLRARADVVVLGNHDHGVAREMVAGARPSAQRAVEWTRAALDADELAFLRELPRIVADPSGLLCAHGCYLNPDHYYGYVTSTMLGANLEAIAGRPEGPRVALCGHTHVAMLAWLDDEGVTEMSVVEGQVGWPADARAVLMNPGAVGQPRDGDPRAAFALVNPEVRTVEFHRVAYDVEAAAREILTAGLSDDNANRLREGR